MRTAGAAARDALTDHDSFTEPDRDDSPSRNGDSRDPA